MLKPVEEKKMFNGPVAAKVGFLLLLLVGGLFIGSYKTDPSKTGGKATSPQVLGETVVREAQGLGKKAREFSNNTVKKVSGFVNEKKNLAGSKASEFVYSAGVNPLLENFKKLPKTDQEKIRKELCVPKGAPAE